MNTHDPLHDPERLVLSIREQVTAWTRDDVPATIALENIGNLLAPHSSTPDSQPSLPVEISAEEPPIIAWMQAWNDGRRAFNDDRWPNPKPAAEYTRNPHDLHLDFALHYWWARGNHGNASPVDNYGHIPHSLFNEDLGRSTPPPEPLDNP
ncbi:MULTISPECIES: hypothetical protein [Amycolatopsis]|uniref:Uncharacterized protein n=1 Tax=Amycolatopsis saalfeldensis TaxID=394193 RepID=A0A1H8YND5_9PSEU|nr:MULTISPECIES: hypothetical protein [Amycolatopsis]SEP53669.1 hypothetical protein SAMN04489732_129115 [Amycolatopsis saalfeldensis]